jgi:hypothetical protein
MPEYQLAKIVIECQEHAVLIESGLQNRGVRFPRQRVAGMDDIVPLASKPLRDSRRKVLVRKKTLTHADFAGGSR